MIRFICRILCLCVLCLVTAPAFAINFDVRNIPPIPLLPSLSEQEQQDLLQQGEDTPMGDHFLRYRIDTPKTWVKAQDSALAATEFNRRLIGEVARYYGPPTLDNRSFISLMAIELKQVIRIRNWFIHHALLNGYTLEGLTVIDENRVEALFVLIQRDVSYRIRVAAVRNGPRVALLMYYVPLKYWEDEKILQQHVVSSFQMITPEENKQTDLQIFSFLDLSQFSFPSFWSLHHSEVRSLDKMEAVITNFQSLRDSDGWIEITMLSRKDRSLEKEVRNFRKKFEERGFVFGDFIERIKDLELNADMSLGIVEVYGVKPKDGRVLPYEFWLGVLQESLYYYLVAMVTPARQGDFYVWAINSEVFQLVVETIGPIDLESADRLLEEQAQELWLRTRR